MRTVIFIWGTKGRVRTAGSGTFNCPNCRAPRQYEHKKAQRWFTLYFIPVFPMETLGESVTCSACKRSFVPAVLEYGPAHHRAAQIGDMRAANVPPVPKGRPRDPANPATWGKVSRNEECPCGSGARYKHCHGRYS